MPKIKVAEYYIGSKWEHGGCKLVDIKNLLKWPNVAEQFGNCSVDLERRQGTKEGSPNAPRLAYFLVVYSDRELTEARVKSLRETIKMTTSPTNKARLAP